MRITALSALALCAASGSAFAAVDGVRGPGTTEYTHALAVQTTQTEFGDNESELNAAYASISGGKLKMLLTGNLQANFNKLYVFFDTKSGGQNQIIPVNPNNDGWAARFSSMRFDTGFAADYMMIFRHGNGGTQFDVDYAIVGGGAADGAKVGTFDNSTSTGNLSANIGAAGQVDVTVKLNNSNTAGVSGGNGAANQADALAVTTGLEFEIDLADIGAPTGDFKVFVGIGGSNHNYWSNQFLGALATPQGNLGQNGTGGFISDDTGYSLINFNNFAGNQFFIVPTPGAAALLGLGGLAVARRRR